MSTAQPVVVLENVSKSYTRPWRFSRRGIVPPESVRALANISFAIHEGEICGLLGVNGAGKTTLIKILASLITPDEGRVIVQGIDQAVDPAGIRRLVGHVNTNERSFYWRLSGRMNLEFFASLYRLSGEVKHRQVQRMLELVDMTDHAEKRFMTYSTGQKQRLAIARALLSDPTVILLDEPTSSLDLISAGELRRFIREKIVREMGSAALWCTHNLQEAREVCDRILILHRGNVVANVSRSALEQEVSACPVYRFDLGPCSEEQLAAAGVLPHSFRQQDNGVEVELVVRRQELSGVLERLLEYHIPIFGFQPKEMSLEDLFRKLVN